MSLLLALGLTGEGISSEQEPLPETDPSTTEEPLSLGGEAILPFLSVLFVNAAPQGEGLQPGQAEEQSDQNIVGGPSLSSFAALSFSGTPAGEEQVIGSGKPPFSAATADPTATTTEAASTRLLMGLHGVQSPFHLESEGVPRAGQTTSLPAGLTPDERGSLTPHGQEGTTPPLPSVTAIDRQAGALESLPSQDPFTLDGAAGSAALVSSQPSSQFSETRGFEGKSRETAKGGKENRFSRSSSEAFAQRGHEANGQQTAPVGIAAGGKVEFPLSSLPRNTAAEERDATRSVLSPPVTIDSRPRPEDLSGPASPLPARQIGTAWHSVLDQVATGIAAHVSRQGQEVVIRLDPPELGNLKIDVVINGEHVQAHIVADSADVSALIHAHLPELKHALQSQNLELGNVRVDVGNWNGQPGNLSQESRQESDPHQRGAGGLRTASRTEDEPHGEQRVMPTEQRQGVSVWA